MGPPCVRVLTLLCRKPAAFTVMLPGYKKTIITRGHDDSPGCPVQFAGNTVVECNSVMKQFSI